MQKTDASPSWLRLVIPLVIGFLVVAALIWYDQYLKQWAVATLMPGEVVTVLQLPVLGEVCILRLARNTGAFLSLGAGSQGWQHALTMIALPSAAVLAMGAWLLLPLLAKLRGKAKAAPALSLQFGIMLFLAGGLGNLIDRIRDGHVVDYLNFGIQQLRTGIMNAADLYIAAGLVCLVVYYLRERKRTKGAKAAAGASAKLD